LEDKRDVLRDVKPFSYKLIECEKARIFFRGRPVYVAVGKDFRKLNEAIRSADEYAIQMAMAKMTGNFKHGKEKK
jgi:hypothetical protein